jgi:hypothetical protein
MNPKASCGVSYPPLRGIVPFLALPQDNSTSKLQFMHFVSEVWVSLQLTNPVVLRTRYWSFTMNGGQFFV